MFNNIFKNKEKKEDAPDVEGMYIADKKDAQLYLDYVAAYKAGEGEAQLLVDDDEQSVIAMAYGWLLFEAIITFDVKGVGHHKWEIFVWNVSQEDSKITKFVDTVVKEDPSLIFKNSEVFFNRIKDAKETTS